MTSGLETEWDYSGRKERDGQKKKIVKANEISDDLHYPTLHCIWQSDRMVVKVDIGPIPFRKQ